MTWVKQMMARRCSTLRKRRIGLKESSKVEQKTAKHT
jgi:hypothetical protein